MKHLRETFTDEEFKTILKVKQRVGKNWHDYVIMTTACLIWRMGWIKEFAEFQHQAQEIINKSKSQDR